MFQGEVDQNNIGRGLWNCLKGSRCICRFPANHEVFFLLDQILKSVAHDRMIVYNEDAEPILLFHLSSYEAEVEYLQ